MVIGVLQVELVIDGSRSLKDKRRIVMSIKDRLHRDHQVSVAEVGTLDDHRIATLGIALASNDVNPCQSTLDKILDKIRDKRGCVLRDFAREVLTGH